MLLGTYFKHKNWKFLNFCKILLNEALSVGQPLLRMSAASIAAEFEGVGSQPVSAKTIPSILHQISHKLPHCKL